MTALILGHSSFNIGRMSGRLAGGPNYCTRSRRFRIPRLLYHSGLDELIEYPQIPTKTKNFGLDFLTRAEWSETKTLSSNLTQQWDIVHQDTIIKEIFSGGITQVMSFMHKVYRFWVTLLDSGEYCLWRPLDRTDKIYRVRVVNMLLDGDEFDPETVGIDLPDKWLTSSLEIWLKLMPAFPPSATIFASGTTTGAI